MGRKWVLIGILIIGMAAAAGSLQVSAGGDPLASLTPRLTQRITAPVISGVIPEVVLSEGDQGDSTPSDVLLSESLPLPVLAALPLHVVLLLLNLAVALENKGANMICHFLTPGDFD